MGYFRVGEDWDGLGALMAAQAQSVMPAARMVMRRQLPAGSIVPTIRARRPVVLKPMTATDLALLRTMRARTQARLTRIRALPVKQVTAYAKSLRGLLPPGMPFGQVDDTTSAEGMTEAVRNLTDTFNGVLTELTEMQSTLPESLQQQLGGQSLAQRAGDFSASLGLDVAWQDLTANCSRELGRLRQLGADLPESILSADTFSHIAAVFKDQGWGIGKFRDFAREVGQGYEGISGNVNDIVADAAAFGEGGLRRMVEGLLSEVSASSPTWLNDANLSRVGGAAQAWVGAAGSGQTSQYVTAAGTSIVAIGAVVPQPAGIIVSAIGALVALIGALLGDEDPPKPPELSPCTGKDLAYNVPWAYNPEAWTALAFWIVTKEGFQESPTYKEAMRSGKLVQEVISDPTTEYGGWWTTIDRYTGEVMVREPTEAGSLPGRQKPLRRLLDIVDRNLLIPQARPLEAISAFHAMAGAFGCVPRDTHWSGRNFLYCYPNPDETFTRFFGTSKFYTSSTIKAFRHDWSGAKQAPEHLGGNGGWDVLGDDTFWKTYRAGLVAAMYLGGTVPYGMIRSEHAGHAIGVVTGVGNQTIFTDPSGTHSVGVSSWTEPRRPGIGSLRDSVLDEWKRISYMIPDPSPEVQYDPSDVVRRPGSTARRCSPEGVCMMMQMKALARPGAVFKREEPGAMSRTTKILLTGGGVVLAGAAGYGLWRRSRRNRRK